MIQWRKSSRSIGMENRDCVELASLSLAVGVRDSKAPYAGHLAVRVGEFRRLVAEVKAGDHDLR
ncbi:DUF397 domain-containing protein [Actinomadura rayongensis]|uniref:DUF397 domain-containing protein n=2 Tax=Actinomadura rayongensis TaxID=1429076 RepID=A0A6I4WBS3_9ACTN|nr:DUF397 domain-containing protein [Actinomadura rayongensis]MXQ68349.1 DUF397 domain-containing protein [Actinomadura rayongensis]